MDKPWWLRRKSGRAASKETAPTRPSDAWSEGWTQLPGYHSVSASGSPPDGTKMCPKCGDEGKIETLFGWRTVEGKRRPQSHCRACRSGKKTK